MMLIPDDGLLFEPFVRVGSRLTSSVTVGKAKFEGIKTQMSMLKFRYFQNVSKKVIGYNE